jgi:hypothetical protein
MRLPRFARNGGLPRHYAPRNDNLFYVLFYFLSKLTRYCLLGKRAGVPPV